MELTNLCGKGHLPSETSRARVGKGSKSTSQSTVIALVWSLTGAAQWRSELHLGGSHEASGRQWRSREPEAMGSDFDHVCRSRRLHDCSTKAQPLSSGLGHGNHICTEEQRNRLMRCASENGEDSETRCCWICRVSGCCDSVTRWAVDEHKGEWMHVAAQSSIHLPQR